MNVKAHGLLSCSALQFKMRYELREGEVGDVVKEEPLVESEESQSQRKIVFEEEAKLLQYIPAACIFSSDLGARILQRLSFA